MDDKKYKKKKVNINIFVSILAGDTKSITFTNTTDIPYEVQINNATRSEIRRVEVVYLNYSAQAVATDTQTLKAKKRQEQQPLIYPQ